MFPTGYKDIANLVKSKFFYTGFCRLWFTPIQNIDVWPAINPATQFYYTEPTLKEGTSWHGPVMLPDKQKKFGEKLTQTAAGPVYKQQLECYQPGDDGYTRINAHNLAFYEFVFIGLVRAGGYFLVFGNNRNGLSLTDAEFENGDPAAGRKLSFTADSLDPAQVLLSFSQAADVTPPAWIIPGDGGGTGGGSSPGGADPLIIEFTGDNAEIPIAWTDDLKNIYGPFPFIQVWKLTDDGAEIMAAPIGVDAPPPDNTTFTVFNTAGNAGFIVINR